MRVRPMKVISTYHAKCMAYTGLIFRLTSIDNIFPTLPANGWPTLNPSPLTCSFRSDYASRRDFLGFRDRPGALHVARSLRPLYALCKPVERMGSRIAPMLGSAPLSPGLPESGRRVRDDLGWSCTLLLAGISPC